jgi:hypothetical protein
MEILILSAFALLGQVAHYIKKAARAQTLATYAEYMFHNPFSSIKALSAIVMAVIGIIASGVDLNSIQTYAMVVMAGYTLDSGLNEFPEESV